MEQQVIQPSPIKTLTLELQNKSEGRNHLDQQKYCQELGEEWNGYTSTETCCPKEKEYRHNGPFQVKRTDLRK